MSAKTLQARQWLVKQLFQIYTILFTGSLVIITIIKVIDTCINLSFDQIIILIAIGVVLFFVLIVSLVLHIRKANKKWVNEPENIHFTPMQFVQLTRFIKFCFCASGAMLLGITIFTTFDTIIPLYQERIPFLSSVLGWLMVWAIFISSCFLFDYYLKISQDGTAFKITPPYDAKEDVKFNELIRISLFALFPIITGIGHICYNNYRPILTFMEMCFCTVCWTAIWYWNVQSTKRRYVRIIGTFIALIVATRILRHIIYPMFF